jgi:anti-sigma factor RsiW
MNCADIRSRLHAYLDQELDLPSVVAIDQHLASCQTCKAIFAQHAALQAGIRRHAQYHAAPAALGERIRAQIGGARAAAPARTPAPRRQWSPFRQWFQFGAAVAATSVVTWIAAVQFYSPPEDEIVAEQVITGHARAVLSSRLVDVATSDEHTVKPWLSSKLDFSPPVTDLTGAGFPLLGGRLDYLDDRPVAALVYRHRRHMIDLFVWPEQKAGGGVPMQSLSKHGYNVLHWTAAGMEFWAISDLNAADMKAFAEAYASAK